MDTVCDEARAMCFMKPSKDVSHFQGSFAEEDVNEGYNCNVHIHQHISLWQSELVSIAVFLLVGVEMLGVAEKPKSSSFLCF